MATNQTLIVRLAGTWRLWARLRLVLLLWRFAPRRLRPAGVAFRLVPSEGVLSVNLTLEARIVFADPFPAGWKAIRLQEIEAMTWPANDSGVVTTNLDAGGDDPSVARADIKTAMDNLKDVINGRNQASGVCPLDSSTKVPLANLPTLPFGNGMRIESTPGSGTFTVPAGVTRMKVTCVGAGGGGGYSGSGDHGGGGGAGGVISKIFDVVPGSAFSFTIGAKGAGHSSGSDGDGADGGFTLVTSHSSFMPASFEIRSNGGGGGEGPSNRFGGAGGSVGTTPSDPNPEKTMSLQGGAGISGSGRGGAGGSNSFQGGVAGSSGYGGGGGFGSGAGTAGFDGTDGFVLFEW